LKAPAGVLRFPREALAVSVLSVAVEAVGSSLCKDLGFAI